jgi:ABC-type transporter Mla subunit MlaD
VRKGWGVSIVQVDPDEVGRAASALRTCGPELDELARSVAQALRLAGDAAGGQVGLAAQAAALSWGTAVATRGDVVSALAAATDAAADAYRFLEAVAQGRFGRTPVPAR